MKYTYLNELVSKFVGCSSPGVKPTGFHYTDSPSIFTDTGNWSISCQIKTISNLYYLFQLRHIHYIIMQL